MMTKRVRREVCAPAKVRPDFIRDVLCDRLQGAIAYGIRRTFKHREDSLSDEVENALQETILTQVENVLYEVLDFGECEDAEDDGR